MMTCSMVSEPGVSDNTGRYRRHPGVAALARRCIVDNDDERADAVEIVSAIWDLSEQLKEPAGPSPVASAFRGPQEGPKLAKPIFRIFKL